VSARVVVVVSRCTFACLCMPLFGAYKYGSVCLLVYVCVFVPVHVYDVLVYVYGCLCGCECQYVCRVCLSVCLSLYMHKMIMISW